MARENNRLSAIGLANKKPGFHPDGRGLYLSVNPSGTRSWIFRYVLRGRSRDMGLGSFPDISLAEARNAATNARARAAGKASTLSSNETASAQPSALRRPARFRSRNAPRYISKLTRLPGGTPNTRGTGS